MSDKLSQLRKATGLPVDDQGRKVVRPGHIISLDPDQLLPEAGPCVESDAAGPSIDGWAAARSAMKMMAESAADIHEALESAKTIRAVPGQQSNSGHVATEWICDPALAVEVRNAMGASATRVASGVERHLAAIDGALSKVNSFIEAKTRLRVEPAEAQDIRRHVFSLPADQRFGWLDAQITNGDLAVAHSVLNASPWASGIEPKKAEILRDAAARRFAPTETAQRDALLSAQKKVRQAMQTYSTEYARRLPPLPDTRAAGAIAALKAGGSR
jgi:hypothetical protein